MSSFLHLEGSLKRGSLDLGWEDFVYETVEDLKAGNVGFDYLIVDEAQNLCDEVFLKLEDALLKGRPNERSLGDVRRLRQSDSHN